MRDVLSWLHETYMRPRPSTSAWPTLKTQRLVIRALRSNDLEGLWELRSCRGVARYQSWTTFSRADARAMIASMRHKSIAASGTWYQFAIAERTADRLIGDMALRFPAGAPGQAEIGFNVAEAAWGKGYGRETVSALLEWLEAERAIRRVFAITDERNHASRRLLGACGFAPAPNGWRLVFFKGEWAGEMVYERLR